MKKKIKISVIILLGLLCLTAFAPLVSATTYTTGETVTTRSPASGMGYSLITKPKYMEYTLVNPAGDIVYQADRELIYVNPILGPVGYEFYDEYSIQVPGFPMGGTWKIQKRLYTEFLVFLNLPASIPDEYSFTVVPEEDIFTNLLAPYYITFDLGMILGRISTSIPFHPLLILLIIAIIIVAILLVKVLINFAIPVPRNNGKRR